MAISEACGLWIEQRIQEELEVNPENPNLSKIGRNVAAEVEKYFEAKVNPDTIRKRASRIPRTNVQAPPTTGNNEEKQENQVEEPKHGGSRKGSGRKPKGQATLSYQEVTEALDFAIIAISQLERIRADDPKRFEAFDKVILWIETRKEDMQNGR